MKKNFFSAVIAVCIALFSIQNANAYMAKYKEDFYKLFHVHYQQFPDDCMENIYWLEQAVKAHPESYLPHYNLAYVALELGDGRTAAQKHYKNGREVGGPVNVDLEERLKND